VAKTTPVFNNFSSGELTPLLLARPDFERFRTGAKKLLGWIVLLQGGVRTRYGTRFGCRVKTGLPIIRSFEPSADAAYILEIGEQYIRFATNGARVESPPGTPVEVMTPYMAADLRALRTAQANDVMIIAHQGYPPTRLSRLSPTNFSYRVITFRPPPTFEAGVALGGTLTLSAGTGSVTLTTSPGIWLQSDVNRIVSVDDARAVITGYVSATVVNATVIDEFASLGPIAAGDWLLEGSPVANVKPNLTGPVGARVTLELQGTVASGTDLVGDGAFTAGQGGWTNLSAPAFLSGTHTGSNNSTTLQDTTKNFGSLGVVAGMRITNTPDGSAGVVSVLSTVVNPNDTITLAPTLAGGAENDFDAGDAYTIYKTGSAIFASGVATLNGGPGGANAQAHIQRTLTTIPGRTYQIQFDLIGSSGSVQVGSSSGGAELLSEVGFSAGNQQHATFEATSTTSYLQLRNNQNTNAVFDNVTVTQLSVDGWRALDVGRYVRLHDGIVQLLSITDATEAVGEVLRQLSSTDAAAAGFWSLEDPSWSASLGYPSVVVLYEGRLYFAGSPRFPQTVWGSAIDSFFDFFRGANAEDGVEFPLVDSGGNITLNQIRALMPAENMLALTTRAEYRLIGSGDDPLTALTPPRVRVQSTYGCDTVQPIKVGPALLFPQRQGSKLREMAFQDATNGFLARDLSALGGHLLLGNRLLELVYQQEPVPIVWSIREDGVLLGLTYDLLEKVEAWHQHTTVGTFHSVAVIPHPTAQGDQLWCVVERPTGTFLEYFDEFAEMQLVTPWERRDPVTGEIAETITGWKGLTVDSAVVYDFGATPSPVLTGLGHLEGQEVAIIGDGAVFPAQVVRGGQLTLSLPVTTAWAGLPYPCIGQTLPVEVLLPSGSSQTQQKAWISLMARLYQTVGLTMQGEQMPFRTPLMPMSEGVAPFTGDMDLLPPGGWDRGATITFEQRQPLPATLLGLFGELDVSAE
jgi:hypothetical protein